MDFEIVLTAKQASDRNAWLDARKAGIGGSDAAIIVGMNKWSSPYQLWLQKTGQVEPEDISDKEPVYWGTQLEDMVAREFCKRSGKKVMKQGLYRSKELPFALASIDRAIVGEQAGLECKTANAFKEKEWEGDNIPDAYYVQCQHYMMVTGYEKWYIACLLGGQHFVWKEVPRSDEDIELLKKAETEFWHKVKNNIEPQLDGLDSTTEALSARFPQAKENVLEISDEAVGSILERLRDVQEQMKGLSLIEKEAKNSLCKIVGDYEAVQSEKYIVKWSNVKGRSSLDSKAIQKDLPDVYAKYLKVGKPSRRFSYEIREDI